MSEYECPYCNQSFTGLLAANALRIDDLTLCPYCCGDLLASAPLPAPLPTPRISGNAFACPRCGSTNLTGDKKGFGLGKAVVGGVLLGGVGLLGGFVGSRKITVTCMQCGHAWEAGKQ